MQQLSCNILFLRISSFIFFLSLGPTTLIEKALNKFKKHKHSVCNSESCLNPVVLSFYCLISIKISKILSRFGFKVSFKPINNIKFSSPKDPIPNENRSGICFIRCSCNLGYIGQTRRRLKARLDEHCHKVKNESIYISSIASHC